MLEFIVAGIIFFAALVFMFNYINTNVNAVRGSAYIDTLNAKLVQISDILVNPTNKDLSLTKEWFVFDNNKITTFKNTYCADAAGYKKLSNKLGLARKSITGSEIMNHINITLSTNNMVILTCGKQPPGIMGYSVKRFGVFGNSIATLTIILW